MIYKGVVELVSQDSENKIDGMIVYEPVEYLEFFQIIIDQTDGPDWKNFEDALGRLDFSDILRDYGTTYDTDSIKYLNGRSIESINQYMFYLMISKYVVDGLNQYMKGDNSPSISKNDIENWLYPIPPIAEQKKNLLYFEIYLRYNRRIGREPYLRLFSNFDISENALFIDTAILNCSSYGGIGTYNSFKVRGLSSF